MWQQMSCRMQYGNSASKNDLVHLKSYKNAQQLSTDINVGSKKMELIKKAQSCFKVFCSSRAPLQQLLLSVAQNGLCCTMGYYQRLRGRHLPVKSSLRAASLQHCSKVPAECFALCVETTLFVPQFSLCSPSNVTQFLVHQMSAASQEERRKRRRSMVAVPLPFLKISLVKFSPSLRLAAQTLEGLQGGRGQRSRED